jgi:small-conductance mechanosensitive channel
MAISTPRFRTGPRRAIGTITASIACLGLMWQFGPIQPVAAQAPTQAAQPPASPGSAPATIDAEPSGETFTLTFANRPIVVLRARILGRLPSQRAAGAVRILNDLTAEHITGPVEARPLEGGTIIMVGSRAVFGLAPADIDELAGETIQGVTAQTVARLRQALDETVEARTTGALVYAGVLAAIGLACGGALLWGLARGHRAFADRLVDVAERRLTKTGLADLTALRASRLADFQRGVLRAITMGLALLVVYGTSTFVLRRFPYTRPWGESMRGFLLTTAGQLGLGVVNAIPGLFTAALIFLATRFLIRLIGVWFTAVEQGRTQIQWFHPETAQPTRRLIATLMWLFAIVVAYPYIPGSDTDAFKGVGVFLGLMMTLGSSGLVNQIMSGFMLTYSRALRLGDFVRIGDIEGTVLHLGVLSVKVKTPRGEEVTIPNAVIVSQTTTDYSRFAETGAVLTPTSVTIGYDVPWRQVEALLLLAAERTPDVRNEPKPVVLQMALEDFYVKYTLFVCLKRQDKRAFALHALHANIQDAFNEHGVQIMSPNYEADPAGPKIVARKNWYAAPARQEVAPVVSGD